MRLLLSLIFLFKFFKISLVFNGTCFGADASWKYSLPHIARPEEHAANNHLTALNAADAKS